jgi:predicted homoserine dehydrogenase-like protein
MRSLRERLIAHEREYGPIRVGLVGTGQMGTGLMSQMELMQGMKVVAAADVLPGRAAAAFREAAVAPDLICSEDDDPARAASLIADGYRVATRSSELLSQIDNLDVIVEATGVPEVGARICEAAINAGRHVVNMNVETDATVGHILASKAAEAGVVYSLAAGDEPGAIKELYDFADALGFEIVAVGKGKNNPLNRASNPDTTAAKAARLNMNPKMLASFEDGSKTMVEMTSIANAIGFPPDVRGAHGPEVNVRDLARVFVPQEDGGILSAKQRTDFAVGDVAPGVFVIITTTQPKIVADLRYLRLNGHGNYWALYRPYHLCNLETPITVANVALDGRETLATFRAPVAETIAVAKRDLHAGETVDSLGGYTVYGMVETVEVARNENLVPLGLVPGARLLRDVPVGHALRYDDLQLNEAQAIVRLRRQQDRKLALGTAVPA